MVEGHEVIGGKKSCVFFESSMKVAFLRGVFRQELQDIQELLELHRQGIRESGQEDDGKKEKHWIVRLFVYTIGYQSLRKVFTV